MKRTRVVIDFLPNVPVLKKLEVREQKRVVASVEGDAARVIDFNFSHLADGAETFNRAYSDNVYRVTAYASGLIEFYFVFGLPLVKNERVEVVLESFPDFAYIGYGESATADTVTEVPAWLPSALTASEVKALAVADWKERLGNLADTYAHDMSLLVCDTSESAWTNTRDHFQSWLGAAWREVERYETDHEEKLHKLKIVDLVETCEVEVGHGAKHWHYHTKGNAAVWLEKLAAFQLWSTNDVDGLPASDWRASAALGGFTAAEFTEILTTYYEKSQAYSVGVEL